jgi:methionyl aminopeptidase
MSIQSAEDLAGLRAAGRAVARVLAAMRGRVAAGVTTAELDAVAARELACLGARSAPRHALGFPGHACISVNDEAVHGVPGRRRLREGDLVKLDVTAELEGYVADAAVTVPVGRARRADLELCAATRIALRRAIGAVRAGASSLDVGRAVEPSVERHGFRVLRELTGHGTGRAVHEPPTVPNFRARGHGERLTEGLVLALEPVVATDTRAVRLAGDGWTLLTASGARAAHFEHTVVVRRGAALVLTAA